MTIRKKTIEVKAFKFNYEKAKKMLKTNVECSIIYNIVFPYIKVDNCFVMNTLEGVREVADGDYIITGINGNNYPCKLDIFKKTYDIIE